MKIVMQFPVQVNQISDNAVEITLSPTGIKLPEVEVKGIDAFAKEYKISDSALERLYSDLQAEMTTKLVKELVYVHIDQRPAEQPPMRAY